MNVSLTPELEALIKQKVASGLYHSASEVVRDALRLLEEHDQLRQERLDALRQDIQEGLASGEGTPLDIEAIKTQGRAQRARRSKA